MDEIPKKGLVIDFKLMSFFASASLTNAVYQYLMLINPNRIIEEITEDHIDKAIDHVVMVQSKVLNKLLSLEAQSDVGLSKD